jgi:hypothetical protein
MELYLLTLGAPKTIWGLGSLRAKQASKHPVRSRAGVAVFEHCKGRSASRICADKSKDSLGRVDLSSEYYIIGFRR